MPYPCAHRAFCRHAASQVVRASPPVETRWQLRIAVLIIFELKVIALKRSRCRAVSEFPLRPNHRRAVTQARRNVADGRVPTSSGGWLGAKVLSPLLLSFFLARSRQDAEQCRCLSRLGLNVITASAGPNLIAPIVINPPKEKAPRGGLVGSRVVSGDQSCEDWSNLLLWQPNLRRRPTCGRKPSQRSCPLARLE